MPSQGMATQPRFAFDSAVRWLKVLTGLMRPSRPMVMSGIITGSPTTRRHRKHTRTKAPPPLSEGMHGKRQMLPSPTAEPVAARMKASRDDHMPCMDVFSMISDPRMIFVVSELAHHCAPRAVGV